MRGKNVTLLGRIILGDQVAIYRYSELTGPIKIGSDTFINRSAYIRPETFIGERVAIGPFVRLITDSHEVGTAERRAGRSRTSPITIGDGAWIGAGVTIIGPVQVGKGAVIGAGSLVLNDVDANTVVVGRPARLVRLLET